MTAGTSQPCICTSLRKASRAVTRHYDAALAAWGMTTVQFALLRNIARREETGGVPLARLADAMVMDRSSLYRTLAPLERRGWVELSSGTGRNRVAQISARGLAAMRAAEDDWRKAQAQVADLFGTVRVDALTALLADMMRDAQALLERDVA